MSTFSSVGDKFMPEMHFKQPGFTYSCGPFTENEERMQGFQKTGDSINVYQNELDKACEPDVLRRF